MTLALKPLPISFQGAETCELENMRAYVTLTRRNARPGSPAWIYAYYHDGRPDHFASIPEEDVMRHIEHELLANDLPEDVPTHIEVTLPRH